jgi:hypothetical protein
MHLLIVAVVVVVVVCLLLWLVQRAPFPPQFKQASLIKWLLEAIVVLVAVGILLRESGLLSSLPK